MDVNAVVVAVLAIVNGAIAVPIVAWLKAKFGIAGGWKAMLLTAVEVAAVTAGYLLMAHLFTWPLWAGASFYAFIQASGIYTVTKKNA